MAAHLSTAATVIVGWKMAAAVAPDVAHRSVVTFTAPHGWHIYWGENAGETGLPTRVSLDVPHSPPAWTAPSIHDGPPRAYVYEPTGAAVLDVAGLPEGHHEVVLRASWIVCREICLAGEAELTRGVDVVANAVPDNIDLPLMPDPVAVERDGDGVVIRLSRAWQPAENVAAETSPLRYERGAWRSDTLAAGATWTFLHPRRPARRATP